MENKELYTKVQETIMEVSLAKSALLQLQGSDEETASLIDFAIERLESAKRIEMDLAIEVVNMDLTEIELAETFPYQFVGEVDKWRNFIDLPEDVQSFVGKLDMLMEFSELLSYLNVVTECIGRVCLMTDSATKFTWVNIVVMLSPTQTTRVEERYQEILSRINDIVSPDLMSVVTVGYVIGRTFH